MASSCPLLNLPPELREPILRHAFESKTQIRVRTPSRKRLRPARKEKCDAQGLLSTCHILREESIPIFYSNTAIIFHCSLDAVEYLEDGQTDPFVKSNISRIVIDDGDCTNMANLLDAHLKLVGKAFVTFKSLKALEFRIYSRHDKLDLVTAARGLISDWSILQTCCPSAGFQYAAPDMTHINLSINGPQALHHLSENECSIRITESQATYNSRSISTNPQPSHLLSCCNIIMDKDGTTDLVLGDAKEAVEWRKARMGAIRQDIMDYTTESRCPSKFRSLPEVVQEVDPSEAVKLAREAAARGGGRYRWSSEHMIVTTSVSNNISTSA